MEGCTGCESKGAWMLKGKYMLAEDFSGEELSHASEVLVKENAFSSNTVFLVI